MTSVSVTRDVQNGVAATAADMAKQARLKMLSGGNLSKTKPMKILPANNPRAFHVNKEAISAVEELVCLSSWRMVDPRMDIAMPWNKVKNKKMLGYMVV